MYLSEIDEQPVNHPKLNSVIVKPPQADLRLTSLNRKRIRLSHRGNVGEGARGRIADFSSTNQNHVSDTKVCVVNRTVSLSAPPKQTETRGTQTDRIGPCKCARQLQQQNQRNRAANKTNKQIVDTLERANLIKFTN